MSENFRNKPLKHENHKKPMTRRDFLAQGFISGCAAVTVPSLMGLLAGTGRANATTHNCGLGLVATNKIPFISFDLAGGANIAGSNVMVGGAGGQLDFLPADGYQKLGLPADMIPQLPGQLNTDLGLAFHTDSAMLRGILSKTSPTTQANVNGAIVCARSENDTGNNPHNPIYGINKAGAQGDLVSLVGTRNSNSGGRSQAPANMIDPTVRPTRIVSAKDAMGLVDTGKLVDLVNQQDAARVMQSIERISALKLDKLTEAAEIKELVRCGYVQSVDLITRYGNPDALNANADIDLVGAASSIFTSEDLANENLEKVASIAKLVINGFAGAGTISIGGYDYHDSTRATGELKDFLAGQAIGATIEYAARKNQPVMIYVFSDGSVASNGELDNSADGRGKGIWKGDNSSTSSVFFLVYDPNGQPQLRSPTSQQIGFFRPSGSLETAATPASNNVGLLAESIVLNYLALHGEVGRLSEVLPTHGLGSAAAIDSLLAFQPIVQVPPQSLVQKII